MQNNYLFALLLLLLASASYNVIFAQQYGSRQAVPVMAGANAQKNNPKIAAAPGNPNCFSVYPFPPVAYGSAQTTTTLNANGGTFTFAQSAGIFGDLYLENGTFEVSSGNTLSFFTTPTNGEPAGKIIVGAGATLRINNATIRGACNSWFGIVLEGDVPNAQLYIQNNSRISNAKYGVYAPPQRPNTTTWFDTFYYIQNSTFSNNLNHIYDFSRHISPGSACLIEACTFTSDKMQMLPPYKYSSPTSNYVTYQALFINPFTYGPGATPPNSGSVRVNGNTINNAVYGIVNNAGDRDYVYITNNTLRSIYTLGIWTQQNLGVNVNGNSIELNASRNINTPQISPSNNATGIDYYFAFGSSASGFINENRVTGQNPTDQVNYKYQTGIIADGYQSLSRNTLRQLNTGVSIGVTNTYSFSLFDNKFTDCLEGVGFAYSPFGIFQRNGTARCNTFEKVSSTIGSVYGFRAQNNAWMPTLGQAGNPNGNRFSSIDEPVNNSGANSNFSYYRLNSSQENFTVTGSTGGPVISDFTVSPINYCQNNSAFNGNGVNAGRQALISQSDLQALMDSVRFRQVPFARQKEYQQQIVSYFAEQNNLPSLERYAALLPATNSEAYGTIALYLMDAYASRHDMTRSKAMRHALLRNLPQEVEVRNRILLQDVLEHVGQWPPVGQRLPQADSTALQVVYNSNTSVSEKAGTWLRYYHPHAAPYRVAVATQVAASASLKEKTKQVYMEAAYPNPAIDAFTLRYRLTRSTQNAELQIYNLLTGRQVVQNKIPSTANQIHEQQIDLTRLPADHYSYQLVLDGQRTSPQHLIIQK